MHLFSTDLSLVLTYIYFVVILLKLLIFFPLIKEKKVYKTNNQRQIAELDLYKIKRNLAKSSSSYLFGTSKFYGMRYLFDL